MWFRSILIVLLLPLQAYAGVDKIYEGELEAVDFSVVAPDAGKEGPFLKDIQRRTPPLKLFPEEHFLVRVVGVHPDHFPAFAKRKGWTPLGDLLWDGSGQKRLRSCDSKTGCSQRPALWKVRHEEKDFFVLATVPSREDVSHWAGMLDQLFRMSHRSARIEALWSQGSTELFVKHAVAKSHLLQHLREVAERSGKKSILLVGYTKMVEQVMEVLRPGHSSIDCDPFFSLKVWEDSNGSTFVALIVRFTFRGTLGLELAKVLKNSESVAGLIFATRVEQHISESFEGHVIPNTFATLSPEGRLPGAPFCIRPLLPNYVSRALHVSTPSSLVDSKLLRHIVRKGGNTTGTEIAYWATGVSGMGEECVLEPKDGGMPFLALGFPVGSKTAYSVLSGILKDLTTLDQVNQFASPRKLSTPPILPGAKYEGPLLRLEPRRVLVDEHALGENLLEYVQAKGPPLEMIQGWVVKVLGIAPEDLGSYMSHQKWKILGGPIWDGQKRIDEGFLHAFLPPKFGNIQRPVLYKVEDEKGGSFLILQTMPSKELVLHWGMVLKQYYNSVECHYHEGSSRRYALDILKDSGLFEQLSKVAEWNSGEAVLILGITKMAAQYFAAAGFRTPTAKNKDYEFFKQSHGFSYTLLTKKGFRPVFIVNIDFPFWGELAGDLAYHLLRSGKLFGLIHLAKVGQMVGTQAFDHPYIPASFSAIDAMGQVHKIYNGNQAQCLNLLKGEDSLCSARTATTFFSPECLSGDHISVPSTVSEALSVMEAAKANGSVTVDVEASHLAQAASDAGVGFSGLYYASDYVPTHKSDREGRCKLTLIDDPNVVENHKAEQVQECILNYLIPALKLF